MLIARLRTLRAVLAAAWPVWLGILGVAGATASGRYMSSTREGEVRIAGMLLQLLGISTVAIGLSLMRRLFGRPSAIERLRGWGRHLGSVFGRRKSVNISAHLAGAGALVGTARARVGASADASVERRLSIVEANLSLLQQQVDEDVGEVRQRIGQVRDQVERESEERRVQDELTTSKLEEVAVGGLHLETVGLLWLALGVIGTSIPEEISTLLGRLF